MAQVYKRHTGNPKKLVTEFDRAAVGRTLSQNEGLPTNLRKEFLVQYGHGSANGKKADQMIIAPAGYERFPIHVNPLEVPMPPHPELTPETGKIDQLQRIKAGRRRLGEAPHRAGGKDNELLAAMKHRDARRPEPAYSDDRLPIQWPLARPGIAVQISNAPENQIAPGLADAAALYDLSNDMVQKAAETDSHDHSETQYG